MTAQASSVAGTVLLPVVQSAGTPVNPGNCDAYSDLLVTTDWPQGWEPGIASEAGLTRLLMDVSWSCGHL